MNRRDSSGAAASHARQDGRELGRSHECIPGHARRPRRAGKPSRPVMQPAPSALSTLASAANTKMRRELQHRFDSPLPLFPDSSNARHGFHRAFSRIHPEPDGPRGARSTRVIRRHNQLASCPEKPTTGPKPAQKSANSDRLGPPPWQRSGYSPPQFDWGHILPMERSGDHPPS